MSEGLTIDEIKRLHAPLPDRPASLVSDYYCPVWLPPAPEPEP